MATYPGIGSDDDWITIETRFGTVTGSASLLKANYPEHFNETSPRKSKRRTLSVSQLVIGVRR